MSSRLLDVADIDVVFLTFDESKKEEFWIQIQNLVPWAKRVDGVKGSDAAHKAAADASTTDRFVLIDGDNIPYAEFFNQQLTLDSTDQKCVFRWRAENVINSLRYGNGGLSCWTKDFVYNMRTHENSNGSDDTAVEFCYDPDYIAMHDCYSMTFPNGSAFQAWRAGFREGVKMCLRQGSRPVISDFKESVYSRNLDHLTIWHNIGRDAEHGIWAIAGSRMGTYMTMLTDWDYRNVQDFAVLEELWRTVETSDPEILAGRVAEDLTTQLDLPISMYGLEESKFFKFHYRSNWQNLGIMVKEIDVIRRQEGW